MTAVVTAVLAALVVVMWGLGLLRPRAAFAVFLCAALYNYWYVIGAGWSVAWGSEGGVSEGAPTAIKYAKDLAFLGVCAGYLVLVCVRGVPRHLRVTILDVTVYAMVGYGLLLACVNVPSLGALAAVAFWQNFGYALAYPCTRIALAWSSTHDLLALERVVLANALVVAVVGVIQFVLGPAPYAYVSGPYTGFNRAVSTLGNPNNFAMVMGLAVLWCVATQRRARTATMLGASALLSLSITAVIGTTGVLLALVLRQLRVGVLLAVGAVGLVSGITLLTAVPAVGTRVQLIMAGEDESMLARLENWRRLVPRSPVTALFGQGAGAGGSMTVSFHDNEGLLADNQYLALLTQFGVAGVLLFLAIVAASVTPMVTTGTVTMAPHWVGVRLAAASGVLAIAVFGLTANILNVFPINLLFWTFAGVVAGVEASAIATRPGDQV